MATAAYITAVYAKSAVTTPISSDKLANCKSADLSETSKTSDNTYLGGAGYSSNTKVLSDFSIDLTCDLNLADTPQALLFSSFASGATVYVTLETAPNATTGLEIGKTYPCIVSEASKKNAPGGVQEVTFKLMPVGIAPTTITAS